jgi:hypothetical protein
MCAVHHGVEEGAAYTTQKVEALGHAFFIYLHIQVFIYLFIFIPFL